VSLILPWLVFPIVVGVLCLGSGTLAARLAGLRPGIELVLPLGYAAVVVVASACVWIPGAAELTAPVVVGLAAPGLAMHVAPRLPSIRREGVWAVAAAMLVLVAYGAPVLASGQPTFAGYISLDDSATWFALTDHVLEHGRGVEGLAPSSHEAAVETYLSSGYPLGALLPFGVAADLLGQDVAWVFQPYLACLAALLALTLFALARPLVRHAWVSATIAVVAAQPALLYAYAQWTGVKELAAAALIALCCAVAASRSAARIRGTLPAAISAAALVAVLSPGGVVWLVGAMAIAAFRLAWERDGLRAGWTVALAALLTVPVLASGWEFVREGNEVLTSEQELGNLVEPLDPLQLAGVWPSADFRLEPEDQGPTLVLIGVVVALAGAGVMVAARRRAWAPFAYVVTALTGAAAIAAAGSPWVDAKAFATASPAVVFASLVACAWLLESGRRVEAGVAVAAIAGGVLWSNALAYHGASLAPHDQLAELEAIGLRYAGQGPALMTEYQPYGVRHFLRRLEAEGVSELRRRPVPRRDGSLVEKGGQADLDELALDGVLVYRTLVLRRSLTASRPPSPYHLRWRGGWYEVWQRDTVATASAHFAPGDAPNAWDRPGPALSSAR
jgi:hypothetical protein